MAKGRGSSNRRSGGRQPGGRRSGGPPRQSAQRGPAFDGTPGSSGEGRRQKGPGGDRVEGRHAVRELLIAGARPVREIVMQSGLDHSDILEDITILAEDRRVNIREVGRNAFDAMSHTESAQGVLAEAAPLNSIDIEDMLEEDNPFLVMLDGVTDPHNLGAVFRSADAAGVTGIVLPKHRSARVSATVTKTAAGAVEHVPIASVAGVPATISLLQQREVWTVGLDERGSQSIHDLALVDQPLCLVLGAEGAGLSRLTRERCDVLVSIPMRGAVASLNVSAAATVAMFDIARRRSDQ